MSAIEKRENNFHERMNVKSSADGAESTQLKTLIANDDILSSNEVIRKKSSIQAECIDAMSACSAIAKQYSHRRPAG